ncbi:MAG: nuclear transport factor 2 family protein [Leptolyngbya sp. BL-A-14]
MAFPLLTAAVITSALVVSTRIDQITEQVNPLIGQVNPLIGQVSPRATQIAEAFLNNLERKNATGLEQLLAPDVDFAAFETRIQGRRAVLEQLTAALEFFDQVDFSNERIGMEQDNRTVLVEAQGRYRLKQNGASLQNSFALVLQLDRNNQVSSIRAQVSPFTRVRESNAFTPIH